MPTNDIKTGECKKSKCKQIKMTSVLFNPYSNNGFCKLTSRLNVRNSSRVYFTVEVSRLLGIFYHILHITDKAPITKALLGTFIASHIGLQVPMFTGLSKYLVCLIPSKYFSYL